jgi:hypothetical protein
MKANETNLSETLPTTHQLIALEDYIVGLYREYSEASEERKREILDILPWEKSRQEKSKAIEIKEKYDEMLKACDDLRAVFIEELKAAIINRGDTKKDVHTDHCCIVHGCKYDEDDCTVESGELVQEYLCEDCPKNGTF